MPTQQNSSTQSELSSSVLTETNTQTSEQNQYLDDRTTPSPPPPPYIGPVMVYSPLNLSMKSDPQTTVEAKAGLPALPTLNHPITKIEIVEDIQRGEQEQTKSKAKLSIELQSPSKTNNTSSNKAEKLEHDIDNADDLTNILQELLSQNEKFDGEMVISSEMLSKQESKQHDHNENLSSDNKKNSKKRAASGFMDSNSKMLSQQKDKHKEANSVNTEDKNKERSDSCNGTSSKQVAMQHESNSVAENDSQTEIDVHSAKKTKPINATAVTSEKKFVGKCAKLTSPPHQEPIVNIPTKKVSVAQQTEPNFEIRNFDVLETAMNDIRTQLKKNRELIERERITSNRERGYARYLQQLILYQVRMLSEKIKYSDPILRPHQSHNTNPTHLSDKAEVQNIRLDENSESTSVAERLLLLQSKLKLDKVDNSSIRTMALKDDASSTESNNLPPTTSTTSAALADLEDENNETISVSSEGQDNHLSKPSNTKKIKPKKDNEFFMGVYWSKQNKHFFIMLRLVKRWKTAHRAERDKGNTLMFAWIGLNKRVLIGRYIKKYHSQTIEWNTKNKTAKVLGNKDHKSNTEFLIKTIESILKKKNVSFKHTYANH